MLLPLPLHQGVSCPQLFIVTIEIVCSSATPWYLTPGSISCSRCQNCPQFTAGSVASLATLGSIIPMVVHSRHRDLLLTRYSPVLNTRGYLTVIVFSRHCRFLTSYSPVLNTREYLIFTVIVYSKQCHFLARYSLALNTRELCSWSYIFCQYLYILVSIFLYQLLPFCTKSYHADTTCDTVSIALSHIFHSSSSSILLQLLCHLSG